MPLAPQNQYHRDLTRRYLIWCYKTTKEELDRIERYFTQLKVDDFILKKLRTSQDYKGAGKRHLYRIKVDEFEQYMDNKRANVLPKKFTDKTLTELTPAYRYLKNRLEAVEEAIDHFLGAKERRAVRLLYEEEMAKRILEARDHRT